MNEELLKEIISNKKTTEVISDICKNFVSDFLSPLTNVSTNSRIITKNEKMIIYKSLSEKRIPPLKEIVDVGANLNTVFFIMEGRVFNLFSIFVNFIQMNDEEVCEFIDLLKLCNYDFNQRTIYNGGNLLLSCILAFLPKASKKLFELGVNYNVTNITQDNIYSSTKNTAEYVFPDVYDELLEQRGFLDKKDVIISDYKELLKVLDEKKITEKVNDNMYTKLDIYIDEVAIQHSLSADEKTRLKNSLYNAVVSMVNNIAIEVIQKLPQYKD